MDIVHNAGQIVTAIGGLGTAAFGLVDATKVFWGGVNHVGFAKIKKRVTSLTPSGGQGTNALSQPEIINTLKGHWFNGTDLASQKSIAKSLVKLHLNSNNAEDVAKATNLDPGSLKSVVDKIGKVDTQGNPVGMTSAEGDLYARFDLIVTALLDEVYQIADQDYRNAARALAVVFSVGLSIAGWVILNHDTPPANVGFWDAVIIGLLATPLAPIAKDLSSALATVVNTLQAVKK